MLVKTFLSLEKTSNGYILHADNADVMLVFLTQDILRIRVSFSREFIERSYALIHTAWEDRLDTLFADEREHIKALDVPYEENEKTLTFSTQKLKLVLNKKPFSFSLYNQDGICIYRDLPERAFERDQLGRLSHYSCMERANDQFFGFGEKTGYLD